MKPIRLSLLVLAPIFFLAASGHVVAQESSPPPYRVGILGGANYNTVSVDTNVLGFAPDASPLYANENNGSALGPYGGFLFEYVPGTLGLHIRGTYDDRSAQFSADSAIPDVDATLRYISIEPALRIAPFNPEFHFLVGPSVNLNIANELDYEAIPGPNQRTEVQTVTAAAFGLWGEVGYDIELSRSEESGTAWYLTPFASAHWIPEQVSNEDLDWGTLTARGGIQLKYAFGGKKESAPEPPPSSEGLDLLVRTPVGGISEQRRMEEFLPLLNYVFFEEGNVNLPAEYRTLSPSEASSFSERSLRTMDSPTTGAAQSASRSQRQLDVYYNVMNIIGDRLRDNPGTSISVVGASENTSRASEMAENVKEYLVSRFGIDPSRIETKGQKRPPHASGTRSTPEEDRDLVAEENVRVEILSENEELLKPVRINTTQDEPLENDLVFELNLTSATSVRSWDLRIDGVDNDYAQVYGPFYGKVARVNATPMLENADDGTYIATVSAETHDGGTLRTSSEFELYKKREAPSAGTRFSILFEYDESKSVRTYDEFLREEVAPRIPDGATIFIHGHTDVTGKEDYNAELSARRAVDAQKILADELKKLGRSVKFDAYGFGETPFRAPFANENPEERYYNRTVMIEIIPDS